MPYLRFLRDDRGYEHTYVLHGFQSGSRPSLLYWFRTPPNLSVGREPLDEEALRAIEESHPELTFDWSKMTKATRPVPPPPDKGARARGRRRERARGARAASESAAAEARPVVGPDKLMPSDAGVRPSEAVPPADDTPPSDEVNEVPVEPEATSSGEEEAVEPDEHPVAALLGEDALNALRVRYAELCELLAESDLEPADQVAVTARLESLNPDAWRPGEETVVGIERFDGEAAAIRDTLDD
ncbi:MAG: hypothetical protein F4Z04_13800 [Acidobacteria bacterium]|nr:hypothetical protein [Acidobacteriota bacterium]